MSTGGTCPLGDGLQDRGGAGDFDKLCKNIVEKVFKLLSKHSIQFFLLLHPAADI